MSLRAEKFDDMVFHPSNKIAVNFEHKSIQQFSILKITSLNLYLSIALIYLHDLSVDDIALLEKRSYVELVLFVSPSLDSTWQIYGGEIQNGVLVRVAVDHPPFLVNLYDATHNNIANIRSIALSKWSYADHAVYLVDDTRHVCVDLVVLFVFVGSMARYKTLTNMITGKYNPKFGLFLLFTRLINFEVCIFHAVI